MRTCWITHSGTVEPTAGAGEIYQPLYEVYRELHKATADLQHRVAKLQLAGA